MSVATIADLRQPPHDPLTLLLGGTLGWPLLAAASPGDASLPHPASLALPRHPGSLRLLSDPSGSLGGRRLPANAALADDGTLWLLRTSPVGLLRFDPCACRFDAVPCLARRGSQPGQVDRPGGIAVAAGHLFVCDTGNQRVQVLLLPQLVVSGVWRAPMPWQPTAVVVDSRFAVHVVDPANGMVHHFGWSGRYLGNTAGVGASTFLGLATDGTLIAAGPDAAYRVDGDDVQPIALDAQALDADTSDIEVAANGAMHLGPLCVPPSDAWFDVAGEPTATPPPPAQLYDTAVVHHVGPLDSLIDDCTWDRVTLFGQLPPGSAVEVATLTAQVPLSPDEVLAMPEQAWETRQTCTEMPDGQWDALIRGRTGRFLWLRLHLAGNGATTPVLTEAVVEFPRISLRRYLPAVFGAEPTSADFTDRLLAIVDHTLRRTEDQLDDLPALFDPHATEHLDWLASWIGMRLDHRLPEALQRDLVANAAHLLDLRGTTEGLRRLLLVALGLDHAPDCGAGPDGGCCRSCPPPRQTCPPTPPRRSRWRPPPLILEHFRLRRWFEAGASRLGDQTVLWGQSIVNRSQLGSNAQVGVTALKGSQDPARDPFHVYAHQYTVFVPATAGKTAQQRKALEGLVSWGSPAHTLGQVEYVEPRMRIGVQSSIGLDTVIARMPSGFTLGQSELGPASVLDGGDGDRQSINNSAVGTTAVLS